MITWYSEKPGWIGVTKMPDVDLRPFMEACLQAFTSRLSSKLLHSDFEEIVPLLTSDVLENLWRIGVNVRFEPTKEQGPINYPMD